MAEKAEVTGSPKDLTWAVERDYVEETEPVTPAAPPRATAEQSVTLDAFSSNQWGAKNFDQAAGFKHWAKAAGHKRHAVAEWRALLAEFSNRAVGAQR